MDEQRHAPLDTYASNALKIENSLSIMRIKQLKDGFEKLTLAKTRIIAHLIADGCVHTSGTDYHIKYSSNDQESRKEFSTDIYTVYGLRTQIKTTRSGKTNKQLPFVQVRSKLAYKDLTKYTLYGSAVWSIPRQVMNANKQHHTAFLRVFFDDEGTVYLAQNKYTIIRAYSINKKGIEQVSQLLTRSGIANNIQAEFGMKRNVFAVVIKDTAAFAITIGFGLERKQKKMNECLRRGTQYPSSRI